MESHDMTSPNSTQHNPALTDKGQKLGPKGTWNTNNETDSESTHDGHGNGNDTSNPDQCSRLHLVPSKEDETVEYRHGNKAKGHQGNVLGNGSHQFVGN